MSNSLWLMSNNMDTNVARATTGSESKKDAAKDTKAHVKADHKHSVSRKYLKESELTSISTDILEQLKEADTVEEALHIMEDVSTPSPNMLSSFALLTCVYCYIDSGDSAFC